MPNPNPKSNIDHDQLFKTLLKEYFREFVEAFLPASAGYLDAGALEFLDKELFGAPVAGDKRHADLVVKANFKDQPTCFLLHVEPESSRRWRRGEFARRMFDYFALLTREYRLPVYPVALLSYDKPRNLEADTFRVAFPDRTVLEFRILVIQLNRLDWRAYLRHDNPAAAALMAKMGFTPAERVEVKKECLRMIARLRYDREKTRFLTAFVDTYLKLNATEFARLTAELEQLPRKERKVTMELTTSWKEEGIQIGLQQGLQKGLRQGGYKLVLHLLTRRVGTLSKRLQSAVLKLPEEQLERLAEVAHEFEQPRDVTRWLREHTPAESKAQ